MMGMNECGVNVRSRAKKSVQLRSGTQSQFLLGRNDKRKRSLTCNSGAT